MDDFSARIRSLLKGSDTLRDFAASLNRIADHASTQARRASRDGRRDNYRGAQQRAIEARTGRILFFLHHWQPAFGATDDDVEIYQLIAERFPRDD